jgi:hypothetical protein
LLDGHRTVEAIAAELAKRFGTPPRQIERDISGWVGDLLARGFLASPSDLSAAGGSGALR